MAHAGFALGGADGAVQIFGGHDVGGGHRPVFGDFDVFLFEENAALGVGDGGGAEFPFDFVVGGDAGLGEKTAEGQAGRFPGSRSDCRDRGGFDGVGGSLLSDFGHFLFSAESLLRRNLGSLPQRSFYWIWIAVVNRCVTQKISFAPPGLGRFAYCTHGFRRGLYSFAALRLKTFNFFPDCERTSSPRSGVFSTATCQKVVVPRGGESGERPPPIHHFGGAARVTSATFSAPISYPSNSLWDGNSTPASSGCQEVITIYCI